MTPPKITCVDAPEELSRIYDIVIPDTNVLLSYPSLIPSTVNSTMPSSPSFDLNHKHIVITSVVNRELDHLKGQHISISVAARNVIRRLEKLSGYENDGFRVVDAFSLEGSFNLRNNIRVCYTDEVTGEEIDFLFGFWSVPENISADFAEASLFVPREDDADGKIIASAFYIKGTTWYAKCREMGFEPKIIALSNDYNMRFRARNFGLMAESYDLTGPDAYSGRRTVDAPNILYRSFIQNGYVTGQTWRQYMPNETPLSPNEFIVFAIPQKKASNSRKQTGKRRSRRKHGRPSKPQAVKNAQQIGNIESDVQPPSVRFRYIARYDAESDRIVALEYLDKSPVEPENPGQAMHIEAMMNPKIGVIITDNNPHYRSDHVAVVTYRMREPAFPDDIYDKFNFN